MAVRANGIGVCDGCAGTKRLTGAGLIPTHYIGIPVSARAIRSVGAARVRRRCPGSLKAPRRVES
jgi:hypothetical protein